MSESFCNKLLNKYIKVHVQYIDLLESTRKEGGLTFDQYLELEKLDEHQQMIKLRWLECLRRPRDADLDSNGDINTAELRETKD